MNYKCATNLTHTLLLGSLNYPRWSHYKDIYFNVRPCLNRIFHQRTVDNHWHKNSYSCLECWCRFDHNPLAHETGSPKEVEAHTNWMVHNIQTMKKEQFDHLCKNELANISLISLRSVWPLEKVWKVGKEEKYTRYEFCSLIFPFPFTSRNI